MAMAMAMAVALVLAGAMAGAVAMAMALAVAMALAMAVALVGAMEQEDSKMSKLEENMIQLTLEAVELKAKIEVLEKQLKWHQQLIEVLFSKMAPAESLQLHMDMKHWRDFLQLATKDLNENT